MDKTKASDATDPGSNAPNRGPAQDFKSRIANSIKVLRAKSGLRQSDLAQKIGLSTRHFQKIESGEIDVRTSTSHSLAQALGTEACYLLRNEHKKSLEHSGILCPVEILDLVPVGIQINDIHGEISYLNRQHREFLGLQDWQFKQRKIHIWDFMADPSEVSNLKAYLLSLVKLKTTPTPYLTVNVNSAGEKVPLRIVWNYIFDSKKNVIGFVSLISLQSEL